jgi:hypothetical protein
VTHTTGPGWTPTDLRRLLSPGRFEKYVQAAGDEKTAAELYVWNSRIGAALHESIGQFEVILRNALDEQLATLHRSRRFHGDGHWCAEPRMPWRSNAKMRRTLDEARKKATENDRNPEVHGKVVAELSLGFWRFTLTAGYQRTLWAPALRHAFPGLPSAGVRSDVYDPVNRLNGLRNRIAHHEPIHMKNLAARYDDLLQVSGWIDEAGAAWIAETSRVRDVLADKP